MRTKIICEAASCWNGDPDLLRAMIKVAAECGGDIFKTQDYRAKNVPSDDPDKKRYEKYQMPDELYPQFIAWCKEFNIEPLTTCFNADRANYLASLGLEKIKLASISLTNTELIMSAGLNFEEVIISTAMHTREEVEEAIDLLRTVAQKFTILHCVGNYPTKPEDANLERIDELQKMIDCEYGSVGFSDHALDLDVAKMALCKPIKYIEKHFSLSRDLPQTPHQMYEGGPLVTTHQVSIEPRELKELADWRDKVEIMRGTGQFTVNEVEQKIRNKYTRRYGM